MVEAMKLEQFYADLQKFDDQTSIFVDNFEYYRVQFTGPKEQKEVEVKSNEDWNALVLIKSTTPKTVKEISNQLLPYLNAHKNSSVSFASVKHSKEIRIVSHLTSGIQLNTIGNPWYDSYLNPFLRYDDKLLESFSTLKMNPDAVAEWFIKENNEYPLVDIFVIEGTWYRELQVQTKYSELFKLSKDIWSSAFKVHKYGLLTIYQSKFDHDKLNTFFGNSDFSKKKLEYLLKTI